MVEFLIIRQGIEFKVLLQVYRALHRQGPSCIVDMLLLYRPSRSLQFASDELLVVPGCRTMLGDRAFSTFSSILWISLPTSVRSSETLKTCKNPLKSYLLPKTYQTFSLSSSLPTSVCRLLRLYC